MKYKTADGLWLRPNENGTLSVGLLDDFQWPGKPALLEVSGEHDLQLWCWPPTTGGKRVRVTLHVPAKGEMVLMYSDIVPGRSNAYFRPDYKLNMDKVEVMPEGKEQQ